MKLHKYSLLAGSLCSVLAACFGSQSLVSIFSLPQPPQGGLVQWLDGYGSARTGSDVTYTGNNCLSFDGVSGYGYVTAPTNTINAFGACTITSVVWVNDASGIYVVHALGAASYRIIVNNGKLGLNSYMTSVDFPLQQWVTVEVDYNSDGAITNVRFDGVEVWSGTNPGNYPSSTFYIGSRNGGLLFKGKIAYLSVPGFGEWTLSEGSGDTLYDISGNGNHMQLLSSATGVTWTTDDEAQAYNIANGFNSESYSRPGVKIPADQSNPGYDVLGNLLPSPGGYVHNGAESSIVQTDPGIVSPVTVSGTGTDADGDHDFVANYTSFSGTDQRINTGVTFNPGGDDFELGIKFAGEANGVAYKNYWGVWTQLAGNVTIHRGAARVFVILRSAEGVQAAITPVGWGSEDDPSVFHEYVVKRVGDTVYFYMDGVESTTTYDATGLTYGPFELLLMSNDPNSSIDQSGDVAHAYAKVNGVTLIDLKPSLANRTAMVDRDGNLYYNAGASDLGYGSRWSRYVDGTPVAHVECGNSGAHIVLADGTIVDNSSVQSTLPPASAATWDSTTTSISYNGSPWADETTFEFKPVSYADLVAFTNNAGPVYISFAPTTGRIRNVQTYEAPLTGSSLNLLELYNGVIK